MLKPTRRRADARPCRRRGAPVLEHDRLLELHDLEIDGRRRVLARRHRRDRHRDLPAFDDDLGRSQVDVVEHVVVVVAPVRVRGPVGAGRAVATIGTRARPDGRRWIPQRHETGLEGVRAEDARHVEGEGRTRRERDLRVVVRDVLRGAHGATADHGHVEVRVRRAARRPGDRRGLLRIDDERRRLVAGLRRRDRDREPEAGIGLRRAILRESAGDTGIGSSSAGKSRNRYHWYVKASPVGDHAETSTIAPVAPSAVPTIAAAGVCASALPTASGALVIVRSRYCSFDAVTVTMIEAPASAVVSV